MDYWEKLCQILRAGDVLGSPLFYIWRSPRQRNRSRYLNSQGYWMQESKICSLKYVKRIELILSVFTTQKTQPTSSHTQKGPQKPQPAPSYSWNDTRTFLDWWRYLVPWKVSWEYAKVQTHQDVYIKCVQILYTSCTSIMGFLGGSDGKQSTYNVGDQSSIPG